MKYFSLAFSENLHTDIIIWLSSCHPNEQRYAAVRYFTNRLDNERVKPCGNEMLINIQNMLHNKIIDKFQKKQGKQKACKQNIEDNISHKGKWVTVT